MSDSESTSATESKSIEFSIPPKRQAVYVAGVAHTSQTGNVQVNYGSKVDGHFIVSAPLSPSGAADAVVLTSSVPV